MDYTQKQSNKLRWIMEIEIIQECKNHI